MSRVLGHFLHLAAILIGYGAASLAASAFLHLLFLGWVGLPIGQEPNQQMALVFSIPLVALFVAYFAFFPAAVVILIAELLGRRDWLTYALGGGVVAALFLSFLRLSADPDFEVSDPGMMAAIVGSGIVGGIGYWLVAGRSAGWWHARPRPPAISPER